MHEEIHGQPIEIDEQYRGPKAQKLPPIFAPNDSRCDKRVKKPENLIIPSYGDDWSRSPARRAMNANRNIQHGFTKTPINLPKIDANNNGPSFAYADQGKTIYGGPGPSHHVTYDPSTVIAPNMNQMKKGLSRGQLKFLQSMNQDLYKLRYKQKISSRNENEQSQMNRGWLSMSGHVSANKHKRPSFVDKMAMQFESSSGEPYAAPAMTRRRSSFKDVGKGISGASQFFGRKPSSTAITPVVNGDGLQLPLVDAMGNSISNPVSPTRSYDPQRGPSNVASPNIACSPFSPYRKNWLSMARKEQIRDGSLVMRRMGFKSPARKLTTMGHNNNAPPRVPPGAVALPGMSTRLVDPANQPDDDEKEEPQKPKTEEQAENSKPKLHDRQVSTMQQELNFSDTKYNRVGPGNLVRQATIMDIDPLTGKVKETDHLCVAKRLADGSSIDEGIDAGAVSPAQTQISQRMQQIDDLQKQHNENPNLSRRGGGEFGFDNGTTADNYDDCKNISRLDWTGQISRAGDFAPINGTLSRVGMTAGVNGRKPPDTESEVLSDTDLAPKDPNEVDIVALNDPNRPPYKPDDAIKAFGNVMTEFEKNECQNFKEIYFAGTEEAEKVEGTWDDPTCNNGYDNEDGIYHQRIGDHLGYRYEILQELGAGAFGSVIKGRDHKTGQNVAIKLIRNKKRFHQQALIEVKILNILKEKDKKQKLNVIHIIDYFYFRNHLCISFELLGMNLYELIKKNNYHGFSLNVVRRIAIALLKCLYALSDEKLIHCDLKPENILIYPKGQGGQNGIKVIDFGASCYTHERVYTYIQSRFYRAPEVILGAGYGMPIDMWSAACIIVELYNGLPIFPGENEHEQIACFLEVLGPPAETLLEKSQRKRVFFDSNGEPRQMTNSRGKRRKVSGRPIETAVGSDDPAFIDFLKGCFDWDPDTRLTPIQAIRHDWIRRRNTRANNDEN